VIGSSNPLLTAFMNSRFILTGALLLGALHARAENPRVLTHSYLTDLRQQAIRQHPKVAAAHARAQAAGAGVRAVRLWDDPELGLGLTFADREMRRDDGDVRVSFSQPLPRPAVFQAERAKASAETAAKRAETRDAALMAGREAATTAIELALADEVVAFQSMQLDWTGKMATNARDKALDPSGSAIEALRLEGEQARDRQMVESARRNRIGLARRLNVILGKPLDAPWPELRLPGRAGPTPVAAGEVARISRRNPAYLAKVREIDVAAAGVSVADAERKPTFAVEVEANFYSGGDFRDTMVGFKMSLPWFNEPVYQARIDQADRLTIAAAKEAEALKRELAGKVVATVTEAENSAREARAFESDVLPAMEKAADATESAWIGSKALLSEVLEARRALLTTRLEQRRAVAAQLAALEELETLVPRKP
jgi:outer membrane protein TolC